MFFRPFFFSLCAVFVFFFFFDKTQRGSGSQESAVERRLGPCALVCVRCVSVHGCGSALCAVPPSSFLSDVDCHVTQCVC